MTGVGIRSSWCRATRISSFPPPRPTTPRASRTPGFSQANSPAESDRKFAFLTIFNKNRPGQAIVADFYTLALFDLDNGTYGTYTDYDMPGRTRKAMRRRSLRSRDDHLDMTYDSRAGTAVWRTCRDERATCCPTRTT